MAESDHSRIPFSLHPVPEAEEAHLLDSQTNDDSGLPPVQRPLSSSSIFRRDGYRSMPSGSVDFSQLDGATQDQHTRQTETSGPHQRDPLGISVKGVMNRMSFARVPVGSKSSTPSTPRSTQGLFSSPESETTSPRRAETGQTTLSPKPDQRLISPLQSPTTYPNTSATVAAPGRKPPMPWDDPPTEHGPWHATFEEDGDIGRATPTKDDSRQQTKSVGSDRPEKSQTRSDLDLEDHDYMDDETFYQRFSQPPSYCDSRKDVHRRRANWLSISIIALSIYSTGMSCLWFIVAIVQPRWGTGISSSSGMAPSTATMVCAILAKTIEISFVTVFVAFIGQVLTRRSFVKKSQGMTLAEMTMRNWVIQPGFMITHWETLPYAAVTFLGAVSLIATIASTFYTTASDVMVSPKLKYGGWDNKEIRGHVLASYANTLFTQSTCPTPLRRVDEDHGAIACLDIQHAGQSYRNLMSFMTVWDEINRNGTGASLDMSQRPVGTTLLYDNTTLTSAWIKTEFSNATAHFENTGRVINNVTLAMPHPGVYDAATNPVNGILQPNDLSGVGEYSLKASVVSPVINVMCVNMAQDELSPLVYTEWPNSRKENTTVEGQKTGSAGWDEEVPVYSETEWLNRTVVDDVFRWGEEYGRRPPVFQLFPADYNTITNTSVYLGDAIYLLAKSPKVTQYTLCEMRSWVTPYCSTHFNISGTAGSHMRAHCEDADDADSYIKSVPDVTPEKPDGDWRHVADRWRTSMDINGGTVNNNASNARTITQFILTEGKLSSVLPSMAEALAVFASTTLIIGSMGSPFVHYWGYQTMQLGEPGALAPFNATIRTQEYTSAHEYEWQNVFYVVLALVFAINVFCLGYFLSRSGLVTDYTEPQNLFALAVNSPPSEQLKGSCGGGPIKRDLVVPWRVAYAKGPNHYFFEEANSRPWRGRYSTQDLSADAEYRQAKERSSYKRLSTSRTWL
ncbi:hypothetical protein CSOJ01_01263 [Colletotrichum sojae]|uniref:MCM2/3/5 family protein n=1 Tax=Colletotrichum sojae TaxID=2175907 RepID=A0A8H6JUP1_9PEZI|nr:hypothetical protein CSOJ01_01263 [Colletotrichum sojae]